RRQQHAAQDDRLAPDLVGEPAPKDQRRGGDQQRQADDVAGGEHVDLLDRLEKIQRPELAAVPDASLPQDDDAGDQHIFDVAAQERLAPGIAYGLPLRLDLLENRRSLQRQPDIDRHGNEQERDDERNTPAPVGEGVVAQVGARADDRRQGDDDADSG